jgi:hypothetical protein
MTGRGPKINVRFKTVSPSREARERVVSEMRKYWNAVPEEIDDVSYWTSDQSGERAKYEHHSGLEGRFQVLYDGPDGHEASRVVYATGGIPYTLVDGDDGESVFVKGWRWVNRLDWYVVILPKNAPKRALAPPTVPTITVRE